jgi:hypothetical protein
VKKTYANSGAFVMDSYPSSGKNLGVLKGKICDFELGDWYDKCQRWKKLAIGNDNRIGFCLGDLPGRNADIPKFDGQWCRSKPYAPNLPGLCYGPKCTYIESYKTWSACESSPVGVQVGSNPIYKTVYGEQCTDAISTRACGLCGTAAKNYTTSESQFSGTMCRSGTLQPANPAFPIPGAITTWQCVGSDGGVSATCTATKAVAVSASCTGTVPQGAYICSGDQTGLTRDTLWEEVDTCTTARKCEYTLPGAECGIAARSYPSSQESFLSDESFCGAGCDVEGDEPLFPQPGETVTWTCKKGDSTIQCNASRSDVSRTTIKTEEDPTGGGRMIEERP